MNNKLFIYSFLGLIAASAVTVTAMTRIAKSPAQSRMPSTSTTMMDDARGGHSMSDINQSVMLTNTQAEGHHGEPSTLDKHETETKESVQALLTVSEAIAPNQPVTLAINIQEPNGKVITKFDTFQEKLMHLIVVSDDLQFFNHIHPSYKGNGRFEVEAKFPQASSYTMFSDYKPSGHREQVSVLKKQVPGNSLPASQIDLTHTKIFGDTKVNLSFSQPTIKVGEEVTIAFDLKQADNSEPVADLQPYLGEKGHLVILKHSSPLTRSDYIHAHAMKDTPAGKVQFMTSFPQPGKYKIWGQFNRNGKILTADFWIDVQ